MIFEEEKPRPKVDAAATGTAAPGPAPNRDRKREPVVIDAVAEPPEAPPAAESTPVDPAPVEAAAAEPVAPPQPEPAPAPVEPPAPAVHPRSRAPLIAAILGGATLAVAGAAALHVYSGGDAAIASLTSQNASLETRLAALEKQASGAADKASLTALGGRLTALEQKPAPANPAEALAALEKRLAAAEQQARAAASSAEAAKSDAARAGSLAAQVASAAAARPGDAPQPPIVLPPAVDLGPLETRLAQAEQRLAAIETAMAGAKTELRATQTESAEAVSGANRATIPVIAQALNQNLDRGAPLGTEVRALMNLGVEPSRLAALEPLSDKGVPTARQLVEAFGPYAAAIARIDEPAPDSGSLLDRLKQSASKLVRVRPPGEAGGDSPAAIASRIEAALARNDLAAALAAWKSLPERAREPSTKWAADVETRIKADAAARSIMTDAVQRLGQKPN